MRNGAGLRRPLAQVCFTCSGERKLQRAAEQRFILNVHPSVPAARAASFYFFRLFF